MFAVIGDYGQAGQPELDVSNLVKSWQPEFIITAGDNNYTTGDSLTIDTNIGKYYHQYILPYNGIYGDSTDTSAVNRFFPSLGNHDLLTSGGQPYYNYFTLPNNERYYDFVWGNVHFFSLNSDSGATHEPDGVAANSFQAGWLMGKLSSSTSKWNMVYFHHPPYSSGGIHGSCAWMRWPFEQWGATAVIGGHDHIYERLVAGNLPVFVNGLGGRAAIYSLNPPIAESVKQYNGNYGAMRVEADSDSIVFEFINISDSLVDRLVLYDSLKGINSFSQKEFSCIPFPNPFYTTTTLFTNTELTEATLFFYDFTGKEVERRTGIHGRSITIGDRARGVYLYKLIQDNKLLAAGKLIRVE